MSQSAKTRSSRRAPKPVAAHSASAQRLVNGESPLPLYHRLTLILRERIHSGAYRRGQVLPTETDLMQAFGVSRITVRRALNDLADERLVVRARGRGTIVSYDPVRAVVGSPIVVGIDGLMANLSIIGHGTTVKVKTLRYIPAGDVVADQLGVTPETTVQHAARVRYLRKSPFSYTQSYLLESIGQSFDRRDLRAHAMIDLIRRAGIQIDRVRQTITCTLADEVCAGLLCVNIGSPLLKLRRVFIDASGRAVNYSEILYTPDRFEYRMNWSRGGNDALQLEPLTPVS